MRWENVVWDKPASTIRAVADGGRLATMTPDAPSQERGITLSSISVRADGTQLRKLAQRLADGQLEIPIAPSYRPTDAAQALAQPTGGTPAEPSSSSPEAVAQAESR